jgi:transposase
MKSTEIFTMALGLVEPWHVSKVEFQDSSDSVKELHIWLEFTRGYKFTVDSVEATAYDTEDKTWRHLNFFEHRCYLHARVPRIKVGEHSIKLVEVPWARKNSGFTLMFEAYSMLLIEREMPVNSVAKTVKESAPRLWRIFNHWVTKAVDKISLSNLMYVGVDETSKRKGHDYITSFVNLDTHTTVFVVEGRGAETFKTFQERLLEKGGKVENIKAFSMDMSTSFISGAKEYFPKADIIFDKFHIVKSLNEALDEVRKAEHNNTKLLKGHRYTFLHLKKNLPEKKRSELETLLLTYPVIGKAYGFKESFMDILSNVYEDDTEAQIEEWCKLVLESTIRPMEKFVNMIKSHMFGIKTMFKYKAVNNGILEGLNSLIQLAKRRARGFANVENFKNMVYFVTGGLQLDYPPETL